MPFCPNCGKEIKENATFCGNCGNQINATTTKNKENFEIDLNKLKSSFDVKKILSSLKNYFAQCSIDYNSLFFKWAMIIFLAIGIGEPLYTIISDLLPFDIWNLFSGASTVFDFSVCAVLVGIFAFPILKLQGKETVKKSNFLRIFWIVTFVLNVLVFLAGINIYQYILYSNIAVTILEILSVVATALLLYKNKPKYPIVLMLSALSFALTKSSMWQIKFSFLIYKIQGTFDNLIDIFRLYSLGSIFLVVALFALVYVFPKKISKWLVYIPSLFVVVVSVINLIDSFSFIKIIDVIVDICIVTVFVLFALSCSRKIKYEYIIKNGEKTQKCAVKVGVISLSSVVVITLTYLLVSAIICSVQINSGIEKWKNKIISGDLNYSFEWSEINKDIFKYSSTKFVSQFVDEYYIYDTLKENRNTMEEISICYSAYKNDSVNDDIIEEYSYINVDDSWADDSILSVYYNKYLEMQPDIENVSASVSVNLNTKKITVTVENDNKFPISECTVKVDFTICFVESGYSSSLEYGRGSKTITIEDISGNDEKTETINFEPDDYYDSYGSYITAFLMERSSEIVSIE